MADYTKLSKLVDSTFKIEKVWGYKWKKWDTESNKMLSSEKYQEGFSKKYEVDTDKGKLDLGTGQLGSLLEGVFKDGKADLNGVTFEVKSNGKTEMEIRYFFNPQWNLNNVDKLPVAEEEEIKTEDIPF